MTREWPGQGKMGCSVHPEESLGFNDGSSSRLVRYLRPCLQGARATVFQVGLLSSKAKGVPVFPAPSTHRAPAVRRTGTVCPEVPPAPSSPLSLQMSQGNPGLGNLLNIKTEVEGSPAVESSPFVGKAVKALVQEKLSEPWKVYLRR